MSAFTLATTALLIAYPYLYRKVSPISSSDESKKSKENKLKIMSKTLTEYFKASWKFLVTIFIIAAIIVFLRLVSELPPGLQFLFAIVGLIFIGFAGWSAIRNHGFNLKQVVFVGLLLSFGSHWTVPIFHRAGEILYFILINSFVFSIVTVLGGWLTQKLINLK